MEFIADSEGITIRTSDGSLQVRCIVDKMPPDLFFTLFFHNTTQGHTPDGIPCHIGTPINQIAIYNFPTDPNRWIAVSGENHFWTREPFYTQPGQFVAEGTQATNDGQRRPPICMLHPMEPGPNHSNETIESLLEVLDFQEPQSSQMAAQPLADRDNSMQVMDFGRAADPPSDQEIPENCPVYYNPDNGVTVFLIKSATRMPLMNSPSYPVETSSSGAIFSPLPSSLQLGQPSSKHVEDEEEIVQRPVFRSYYPPSSYNKRDDSEERISQEELDLAELTRAAQREEGSLGIFGKSVNLERIRLEDEEQRRRISEEKRQRLSEAAALQAQLAKKKEKQDKLKEKLRMKRIEEERRVRKMEERARARTERNGERRNVSVSQGEPMPKRSKDFSTERNPRLKKKISPEDECESAILLSENIAKDLNNDK